MHKEVDEDNFINLECIPLNEESGIEKKDSNEIENEHMQKLGIEIKPNENFFIVPEEFEFDLDQIANKKTSSIVLESTIRNISKSSSKNGQIKLIAPFRRKKIFRIKFKKFNKKVLDKKKAAVTAHPKDCF